MNNFIKSRLPSQAPIINPLPIRLPRKSGGRPWSSHASACFKSPSSMLWTNVSGVGRLAAARLAAGSAPPIPIIMANQSAPTVRFIVRFISFFTQAKLHFLMIRTDYRLALALTLSLLFHTLPFLAELLPRPPAKPATPPPLQVSLKAPPPPIQPQWIAPPPRQQAETGKPAPRLIEPTRKSPSTTKPMPNWTDEVRRQFRKQHENGDFYPTEAIARGLEGEALIFAVIDSDGHVAAARVEQGSGFTLLDQAALRAVRSLRALPADTPRETLLPVRFRLK
ncbi:MAG: energy transducer TonB [Rhodocyclales bacterium GT-UBC]|nr:MAG: energy transducer TonB [Rhodocyclales bacterium GT-UBC]